MKKKGKYRKFDVNICFNTDCAFTSDSSLALLCVNAWFLIGIFKKKLPLLHYPIHPFDDAD